MYQNELREQLLFFNRALEKGKNQSYIAKVISFNSDNYTLSAQLLLHQQEPVIVNNISVFSSPLISSQLRPNDYGVLINLGFDIGDFFSTQEIGNNDCDSFIFLPLNLNPNKQGTYIQAPTNDDNHINIGNDSVNVNTKNNNITLNSQNITLEFNQSKAAINNQEINLNAPQVEIQSQQPLNLNGASLTEAFNSILEALNQINASLQTIKYMPGSMTVPPITINASAITNISGKIK